MIYYLPLLIQWGFIAYLVYCFYQLKQFKSHPVIWTKEVILTFLIGLPLVFIIGMMFHLDPFVNLSFSLGIMITNELKKYLK